MPLFAVQSLVLGLVRKWRDVLYSLQAMTHADRVARQLENGKSEIHAGAIVEAVYKPTGARGRYRAVKVNGVLVMKPEGATLPECGLEALVILRVVRRGFGG